MIAAYEAIQYDGVDRVAAFRERRAPEFALRAPDDLPDAYPWWEPDEWST